MSTGRLVDEMLTRIVERKLDEGRLSNGKLGEVS